MFKIALLCFKCLNNTAPKYLCELISPKADSQMNLRIDYDYFLLEVPSKPQFSKTENAFIFSAPKIWNVLPYNIRSLSVIDTFKYRLKAHYFTEVFHNVN